MNEKTRRFLRERDPKRDVDREAGPRPAETEGHFDMNEKTRRFLRERDPKGPVEPQKPSGLKREIESLLREKERHDAQEKRARQQSQPRTREKVMRFLRERDGRR